MAKILLVEDDNNLREIYEARLMAEGYEIVSARDGEEALTVAMKEKPDLIISDVMMPKISGFDMLDILRTTEETKNAKVIMMTALSQAEDKARAEKLGADRYLVKSQVTLEDVAKVAQDVLEGKSENQSNTEEVAPVEQAAVPEPVAMPTPPTPTVDPAPEPVAAPAVSPAPDDSSSSDGQKKVIQPINDLNEDPEAKLKVLLEKEKEREQMAQVAKETVQKAEEAAATPVTDVPAKVADAPTDAKPVEPPKQNNGVDPNSIAL